MNGSVCVSTKQSYVAVGICSAQRQVGDDCRPAPSVQIEHVRVRDTTLPEAARVLAATHL